MGRKNDEGIAQLASAISERIGRQTENNEISLDFGTILPNMNLQTDSFPVEIQKKDYATVRCNGVNHTCHWDGELHCDGHMHLKKGDRVLVIWVSDTPVIVAVIDS